MILQATIADWYSNNRVEFSQYFKSKAYNQEQLVFLDSNIPWLRLWKVNQSGFDNMAINTQTLEPWNPTGPSIIPYLWGTKNPQENGQDKLFDLFVAFVSKENKTTQKTKKPVILTITAGFEAQHVKCTPPPQGVKLQKNAFGVTSSSAGVVPSSSVKKKLHETNSKFAPLINRPFGPKETTSSIPTSHC